MIASYKIIAPNGVSGRQRYLSGRPQLRRINKILEPRRDLNIPDPTTILQDHYTATLSRQISLLIRSEVLNGRANFGVYGDGKEVAQLAMVRAFQPGDFRAGYYRDQTFMLATQMLSPQQAAFCSTLRPHGHRSGTISWWLLHGCSFRNAPTGCRGTVAFSG